MIETIFARMRRLVRPPRVMRVVTRPAGYLAIGRRGLSRVVAWALYDDGQIIGLVADRRGRLLPASGRYLPGGLHDETEVSTPIGSVPVADLEAAVGRGDVWTPAVQAEIFERLREAALGEWATRSFAAFVEDSRKFLENHFRLIAEHGRRADLDATWLQQFAPITDPAVAAAIHPVIHAEEAKP